jgi:hypothetical protein
LLKNRLSPDAFARLQSAIPKSGDMLESAQARIESGGAGLLENVKNIAGKIFGGGGQDFATTLESHFSNAGVSAEQLKSFLPKLRDMLADKLPTNVLAQIEEHVPGFGPPEEEHASSEA